MGADKYRPDSFSGAKTDRLGSWATADPGFEREREAGYVVGRSIGRGESGPS